MSIMRTYHQHLSRSVRAYEEDTSGKFQQQKQNPGRRRRHLWSRPNHHESLQNYEAGLIPLPPKNFTCSFWRREFRSAQALGGHMNIHRRDRAKLSQIPSWLFEPHYHIPVRNSSPNPNFSSSSSSSTTPTHLETSLTNQISKTTPFYSSWFHLLNNTTRYGGLMVATKKNKSNVCSRELKKSAMDSCHAARCEISRGDLTYKKDGAMGLDLGMHLRNPKQVLDLELRLGCL